MREHTPDKSFRNARALRRRLTNAEEILWRELRGRKFNGIKFRRQMPIGPYVADFACISRKVVVECDGRPHDSDDQQAHDAARDLWLAKNGWRVLRIPNNLVLSGSFKMLEDVSSALRLPSSDPR